MECILLKPPKISVSEFRPASQSQTIARAEPVSCAIHSAFSMADMDAAITSAQRRGPFPMQIYQRKIFILLESYGTHVTVYHVPSHARLSENERVH